MNIAVIFAGGVGKRMNPNGIPKQFLLVNDKPIIIYTLEKFQNNPHIDAIVISCVAEYIDHTQQLVEKYGINKVKSIVKGGENGQGSIYNGLLAAEQLSESPKDVVLVHDGVRPLIDNELIDANIASVERYGSGITCVECKETVAIIDGSRITSTTDRSCSRLARAPQSFRLGDILEVHRLAISDGNTNVIDSCTLMQMYGRPLFCVPGSSENIKITTPDDYFLFKAILASKESRQAFG